ncbi:LAMI_0E13124g1_1 [Lachancea mirantina]|uniref:LAMI_0E13124g1_1 n=1 Tax=Lachancea mirantina TaxID=1230905 RepID=A0A1G4JQJ3_9SACH|nr:LAMI_0E13124g1_1 [Lachancea mirantina]
MILRGRPCHLQFGRTICQGVQQILPSVLSRTITTWKNGNAIAVLAQTKDHLKLERYNELKRLKNSLIRKYETKYLSLINQIRKVHDLDENLVSMIFYRHSGKQQFAAFSKYVVFIVHSNLATDEKKKALYGAIRLQHALYPKVAGEKGILIPEKVHDWFWLNLPRTQSFAHYYFLIQNNVLLSSAAVQRFSSRLLKGSEMEQQLATFQIFLQRPEHCSMFDEKFVLLNNFTHCCRLTQVLIRQKDFRHVESFFKALLVQLSTLGTTYECRNYGERSSMLLKFVNTILLYLRASGNTELFLQTFTTVFDLISMQKLDASFLHKPLIIAVVYLRGIRQYGQALKLISYAQDLPTKSGFLFKQMLIGELLTTFRRLGDFPMILKYVPAAFSHPKTAILLNKLGLRGLADGGLAEPVPESQLHQELASTAPMTPVLPKLRKRILPNSVVLTELYRAAMQFTCNVLERERFKGLILKLYDNYKKTLLSDKQLFFFHDYGVINVLLHTLRFQLKEHRMAFVMLKDFMELPIKTYGSPSHTFGLVLYNNYALSQSEVSSLLVLMDKKNASVDFKIIVSMILRHLRWEQEDEAHSWFKKLTHARFPLEHKALIQQAVMRNWKLPSHVDTSFLQESSPEPAPDCSTDDLDELLKEETFQDESELQTQFANDLVHQMEAFRITTASEASVTLSR